MSDKETGPEKSIVPEQTAGELLIYQTEDGLTRIEAKMVNESVWLTQAQMTVLFQKEKSTISEHISAIFDEGELDRVATVRKFRTVQTEGERQVQREIEHYNLDVVISVGYRVKSHRGTQFRIWATQRLRDYIIKGFAMDDERLKQAGGGNYFDELLSRIRDIRASEKVFWKKVLEIYATSIDYNSSAETSQQFFKVIQNKMHWAAHGHTAAEVIMARADAAKPNMGMTAFSKGKPKRTDTHIAKNYLNEDELDNLNRIVSMYLDFAELQAKNQRPMYMADWVKKLDDFLRISERDILTHAGKVSQETAKDHADAEFDKFQQCQLSAPSTVEKDFEKSLDQLKQIEAAASKSGKRAKS